MRFERRRSISVLAGAFRQAGPSACEPTAAYARGPPPSRGAASQGADERCSGRTRSAGETRTGTLLRVIARACARARARENIEVGLIHRHLVPAQGFRSPHWPSQPQFAPIRAFLQGLPQRSHEKLLTQRLSFLPRRRARLTGEVRNPCGASLRATRRCGVLSHARSDPHRSAEDRDSDGRRACRRET